jgi:hypothetical protein
MDNIDVVTFDTQVNYSGTVDTLTLTAARLLLLRTGARGAN